MGLVVLSAGSNARGQLAQGTEEDSYSFHQCSFLEVGSEWPCGSKVLSIAAGANHTLLLLRSVEREAQLWGCGDGRRGQLGSQNSGISTVFKRLSFDCDDQYTNGKITSIAAAWETSFVIFSRPEGDVLLSAGGDDFGDLGVGGLSHGRKETGVWQLVRFNHVIPENATGARILQLKSGPHSIIAHLQFNLNIHTKAEVFVGWGAARHGQLGGPTADRLPKKQTSFVASPRKIDLKPGAFRFAVGNQHSVFLAQDDSISAFGSNKKNQISGLASAHDIVEVGATWNSTYLVQKNGEGCGEGWSILTTDNSGNQLAQRSEPDGALPQLRCNSFPSDVQGAELLAVACGSEHVLVSLRKTSLEQVDSVCTEVYGWGWNEHGNLGLGHTNDMHVPSRVWPDSNDLHVGKVAGVWGGCATSWLAIETE
ncbi:hypothetical protein M0805_003274 [Coniferiporia weirii]|nr:hypothetical protein M0805_003274 [Coniferiporia weirii]